MLSDRWLFKNILYFFRSNAQGNSTNHIRGKELKFHVIHDSRTWLKRSHSLRKTLATDDDWQTELLTYGKLV